MADNENHPLVDLMLARMDTHPEEFDGGVGRWYNTITDIEEYAPPEQAALFRAKLANIRLDKAHHTAMDELLNGEERRRQKAEVEAMRNTYTQQAQQSTAAMRQQLQGYQNAAGPLQGVPSSNIWLTEADVQSTVLGNGLVKKLKGALKL